MFPQSHGLTPSACWTFGTRASCGRGPTPASLEDKHAVAMEDGRSACVINQYDDLGPATRSSPRTAASCSRRRATPSLCSAVPTTYALMSTPPCSNGGAAPSAATASSPCTARRTCSTSGRRRGRRSSDCQTISLFTLALHH